MRPKGEQPKFFDSARGMKIRRLREDVLRESQDVFADRFGVSQVTVGRWEQGSPPDRPHDHTLARLLDESIEEFLYGKPPPARKGGVPNTRSIPKKQYAESHIKSALKPPLVSSYDPDALRFAPEEYQEITPAAHTGGTVNIAPGEIPEVSARLGMGLAGEAQTLQIPVGRGAIAAVAVVDTWKIPERVLRRRLGASLVSVHIVECEGDSMEPRINDGDFVFIDTSRRIPSPPGIFAVHDGFGQTLKHLELVPNSEPPKVVLVPENPKYTRYERSLDEVSIIGRYLCRLTMG